MSFESPKGAVDCAVYMFTCNSCYIGCVCKKWVQYSLLPQGSVVAATKIPLFILEPVVGFMQMFLVCKPTNKEKS